MFELGQEVVKINSSQLERDIETGKFLSLDDYIITGVIRKISVEKKYKDHGNSDIEEEVSYTIKITSSKDESEIGYYDHDGEIYLAKSKEEAFEKYMKEEKKYLDNYNKLLEKISSLKFNS